MSDDSADLLSRLKSLAQELLAAEKFAAAARVLDSIALLEPTFINEALKYRVEHNGAVIAKVVPEELDRISRAGCFTHDGVTYKPISIHRVERKLCVAHVHLPSTPTVE